MKPIDPRLLRWAPAARTYLAVSAGIALVQTAVVIAFAGLLATGITAVAEGRSPAGALPWLALVVVVRAVLLWVSEAWGARAAAQTGRELRDALLDAIARRGPAWLGERNRSALAVIAGHGLDALDPYFARYIPQLVLTAIATPVIVVVMWWQDWPSGLAAVVTLPLIPLFLILIGIATRGVQRRQLTVLQTLAARFADTVQGLATLRLFGRERRAAARMRETAEQYRRETLRVLRYSFLSGFALELLSSLAVAIIAVSVGLRLLDGELTLGVGLFVLLLAPEAFLPLRQVGVQFHAAAEGVAATEDVFEILDASAAPPAGAHGAMSVATPPSGQPTSLLDTGSGIRLVVDGVAVRHGERRLPEVSFTAEPGTVTLLEGRSGSGKSSLLAALRGAVAYDGSIRVDGAATADPSSWLAWAGQRPGLIRGTIAANVALGDPAPDAARVRAALDDAAAADLDPAQELGVQGAGLSGGQAQRVGVARALYRLWSGARVLVLDEPSSALDAATEERLWRAIRRAADGGATVLLVSHRHSARAIADRVVRIGEAESAADTTLRSAPGAGSTASGPSERQPSRPEPIADPEPGPESDPIPDLPASVGGILRLAMPRARRFAPAVLAGIVSAAAAVGLLLVSGWLIVSASIVDSLVPLSVAIVGVRFFAVTRAVTRYLERLAGHDAALGRLADLRAAVVRRLTPFAPAGLGATDRGSVLAALVDDVENLQNLLLRVVQPLLTGGVVAVVSVGVLALIAPAAAVALAVCLAIAVVGAVVLGGSAGGRAERAVSRDRAELAGALVDELTALDVLQAYGAERVARERIRSADASLRRTVTRAAVAQALSSAVVSLAAGAASIAALALAAPGQPGGAVDAPWFAVAVLLPMAVFDVFSAVPQAASAWRGVRASAERIHGLLPATLPSEVRDDDGVPPHGGAIAGGALRLRGVTASWPGAATPALRDLDLDVAPGERILVTGSSGAGKSTLAAVLVGFLRSGGSYRIGEDDAGRVSGPELRRHVGLCEQDPMLFDEDIRQNLLFARETATDADLLAVLDRVGLAGWVAGRGGLDARVGERGALISGGQAQRLALARALLRGFPVLVLDEPTAGVDPDASDALLRDLLGAAGRQTVILVSHVAPPDGLVDRTVRLDAGRILPVAG
ncbi:thiol reductant ABC exporter subunit CydD [Microbacterium azadirachtae]|uniref:thiol reductant ABC exporter subunit CydD n=2 Tax=Microbacterium azadirachtae TaxID=582680 RepID=UPI00087E2999|nr:thiol reductant ABC exporter subunit CydD [Microbacterium azadirachtae]SDM14121.1 ATP-binding cassette, subfamily C, CydCD [Microbacterium azadirachtae]SEG38062.1 ATP-binding cassette, subfamily C, CydCD [Microbacterium azadirachtae]SEG40736.1 ATP-binding cassette, subfamily C, CydCD [Microbacterium azadirachtae]